MKIKRFTARDLPAATNLIKQEFGLAALILSQRDIPADQGGGVEITAGVRDEDLPVKAENDSTSPVPRPKTGFAAGAAAYKKAEQRMEAVNSDEVIREVEKVGRDLGGKVSELKDLILDLAHRQSLSEKWRNRPDIVGLYRRLLSTGLSFEHSRILVENAAESAAAWGGGVESQLRKTMQSKLRIADLSVAPPKFLALVGPSGSGKTVTLVNMAAFYRQRGLSVAAITLDTLRLGAAEQLTQYARILGLGVSVCQNHEEFDEAMEIFSQNDLILIDTPSRGFQKKEGRQELAVYFNKAEAQTLLVLPATMKESDLKSALEKGRFWREAGVALTKFDETESLGDLVGFISGNSPRLSFFSLGPKPFEDFVIASTDRFLNLWLGADEENDGIN